VPVKVLKVPGLLFKIQYGWRKDKFLAMR